MSAVCKQGDGLAAQGNGEAAGRQWNVWKSLNSLRPRPPAALTSSDAAGGCASARALHGCEHAGLRSISERRSVAASSYVPLLVPRAQLARKVGRQGPPWKPRCAALLPRVAALRTRVDEHHGVLHSAEACLPRAREGEAGRRRHLCASCCGVKPCSRLPRFV